MILNSYGGKYSLSGFNLVLGMILMSSGGRYLLQIRDNSDEVWWKISTVDHLSDVKGGF